MGRAKREFGVEREASLRRATPADDYGRVRAAKGAELLGLVWTGADELAVESGAYATDAGSAVKDGAYSRAAAAYLAHRAFDEKTRLVAKLHMRRRRKRDETVAALTNILVESWDLLPVFDSGHLLTQLKRTLGTDIDNGWNRGVEVPVSEYDRITREAAIRTPLI